MKVQMIRDYLVINGRPSLMNGHEYELEREDAMSLVELRFAEYKGSALDMFEKTNNKEAITDG